MTCVDCIFDYNSTLTKSKKMRHIPICKSFKRVLEQLKSISFSSGLVCPFIHPDLYHKEFKRSTRLAKLKLIRFHDLRHTFASNFLMGGGNIYDLQNNLSDGQILVSELGEIWRWDGFTSKGKQSTSTKAVLEQLKNRRLKQLSAEEKQWQDIMTTAKKRTAELHERKNTLGKDLLEMQSMPKNISSEKTRLQNLITENKVAYDTVAGKLRDTEHQANEINKKLKLEEVRLNELREEKIRLEGAVDTINETNKQLGTQVRERLGIELTGLFDLAQINPNKGLAELDSCLVCSGGESEHARWPAQDPRGHLCTCQGRGWGVQHGGRACHTQIQCTRTRTKPGRVPSAELDPRTSHPRGQSHLRPVGGGPARTMRGSVGGAPRIHRAEVFGRGPRSCAKRAGCVYGCDRRAVE